MPTGSKLVWIYFKDRRCSTKLTTIDYFPVITHPITEYDVVQETLKYAEEATKEVNQKYVMTTYDLGVCMKAFPIIWNEPRKYKKHIIMIGSSHILCAYMKMIGNKMQGTGLSDILLESELVLWLFGWCTKRKELCKSLELPQSDAGILRKTPV